MKVAVVYNRPESGIPESEDVLIEIEMVTASIQELGYLSQTFPFGPEREAPLQILAALHDYAPDAIFNLVESIGDDQRLYPAAAALFELAEYPYTGSPFEALLTTTDKALTKGLLSLHGIPTPPWQQYRGAIERVTVPPPFIIKPAWEDASVGIDDSSLIRDPEDLLPKLSALFLRHRRQPILIEQFIDGAEFNVSLLERPDGSLEVLPLAEMVFHDWPEDKPRIVNYRAKWDKESFEYRHTIRRFDPPGMPLEKIRDIGIRCWDAFLLRGYARIDMRLDRQNNPYVIEVNTNPCISQDAGFMAAAHEAGYQPKDVIDRMLKAALREMSGWKTSS